MKILKNQAGQAMSEYVIILVLVSIVCIAATTSVGRNIRNKITTANDNIRRMRITDE